MSSVNWWITTSFSGSPSRCGELRQPRGHGVDLARVDAADHLARHLSGLHPPLGVEREADVRLAQPALQPRGLGEEVRAPRAGCRAAAAPWPCARRSGSGRSPRRSGARGTSRRRPRPRWRSPRSARARAARAGPVARRPSPGARAGARRSRGSRSRARRAPRPAAPRSTRRRGAGGRCCARRGAARAARAWPWAAPLRWAGARSSPPAPVSAPAVAEPSASTAAMAPATTRRRCTMGSGTPPSYPRPIVITRWIT